MSSAVASGQYPESVLFYQPPLIIINGKRITGEEYQRFIREQTTLAKD